MSCNFKLTFPKMTQQTATRQVYSLSRTSWNLLFTGLHFVVDLPPSHFGNLATHLQKLSQICELNFRPVVAERSRWAARGGGDVARSRVERL